MNITNFEQIIAWQKARELSILVYKTFGDNKDFGFKDQIQRAAISVMNNIAEGFERYSAKEFINFLFIARGSCGEVRSMIHIAKDLKYVDNQVGDTIELLCIETSKLIYGFIRSLR